jgi:hypothetical protein
MLRLLKSSTINLLTVEGALIGHIVNKQYAHSTSVISSCDGSESLLSGCVPYLQLHSLSVQLDSSDFEVDADRCDERWGEGIFTKSEKTA